MGISQRMATGGWPTSDPFPWVPSTALANAEFILDAGDSSSYSGSGTTWSNLVAAPASGAAQSAYNFTTSGLTFSGTAGNKDAAEYFSTAGSGYATIGSNTTFLNSLHKSGAAFTILCVAFTSGVSSKPVFGTHNNSGPGLRWGINGSGTGRVEFYATNAVPNTVASYYSDYGIPAAGHTLFATSLTADGSSFHYCNGSILTQGGAQTFTATYSSPSAASAAYPAQIYALGNNYSPAGAGFRIPLFAMFNRAMTADELAICYNNLRTRWGI